MSEATFTCKDLDGNDVVITYKTILSAYDQEKIDEIYMNNLRYNPETQKAEVDWSMGNLPIRRQNAMLENVIKRWSREEPVAADTIKKALTRSSFSELIEQLEAVVAQGEVDDSKKKSLPND